jgi:hypothetical protein
MASEQIFGVVQTDLTDGARVDNGAPVQIAGSAEILLISMDTLLIGEDSIPSGGRCGALEPESAEVEPPLANAMHQLDA